MRWTYSAWNNSIVFVGFSGLLFFALLPKGWLHTIGIIAFGLSILLLLGEIIARMEHKDNVESYENDKKAAGM